MRRLLPRRPLIWWQGTLVAFGATAAAWAIRAALHGLLQDQSPYATLVLGVVLTTIFGGWRNGVVAALLGGLLGNVSFVPPRGVLHLSGRYGVGLASFFMVSAIFIWIMQGFASAHRRATALNEQLVIVGHEYRHRIKNLLAMAQAIVQQTGRYTRDVPEFQEKVVSRFQALARAQDLLSESDDDGVELHHLIERTLAPFDVAPRMIWPMSGPPVRLQPDGAVALALFLNELATNATKYGAFSVPEGRLGLRWELQGNWAVLEWLERQGPRIAEPTRRGFGSRLFEQAMPRTSGRATLTFEREGLRCEIRFALAECSATEATEADESSG